MGENANTAGVYVFTGLLTQRSALSVGGSDEAGLLDDVVCRDGLGRPTLRGSNMAGNLFDTLRKLGYPELPAVVTGNAITKRNDEFIGESVVRVWASHPKAIWHATAASDVPAYPRQSNGIRQDTGAAQTGALFDLEVLPVDTQWPFVIEFDAWRYTQLMEGRQFTKLMQGSGDWSALQALGALRAAISQWEAGFCWIGRGVARGMGWMVASHVKTHAIPNDEALTWTAAALFNDSIRRDFGKFVGTLPEDDKAKPNPPPTEQSKVWGYIRINGMLTAGVRHDGYGLDSLSIGGHQSATDFISLDAAHLTKPTDINSYKRTPDMSLAFSPRTAPDGKTVWEPYIPGSSIRGPLRHRLSHDRRALGEDVLDPVNGERYASAYGQGPAEPSPPMSGRYSLNELFGELPSQAEEPSTHSARLLVRDAYLDAKSKSAWKYAVMQLHAEDEFTGGAFAGSKFDRLAILKGRFEWEMVIEFPPYEEKQAAAAAKEIRERIEQSGGHGVTVGGAQWRGHGWLTWSVYPSPANSDHQGAA